MKSGNIILRHHEKLQHILIVDDIKNISIKYHVCVYFATRMNYVGSSNSP